MDLLICRDKSANKYILPLAVVTISAGDLGASRDYTCTVSISLSNKEPSNVC